MKLYQIFQALERMISLEPFAAVTCCSCVSVDGVFLKELERIVRFTFLTSTQNMKEWKTELLFGYPRLVKILGRFNNCLFTETYGMLLLLLLLLLLLIVFFLHWEGILKSPLPKFSSTVIGGLLRLNHTLRSCFCSADNVELAPILWDCEFWKMGWQTPW